MRIVAPTYFQTPNDLVDHWLPKLGEAEVKILLVVFRKTFGWHKTRDRISLSQFEKLTGLTRTNCCKAISSLIAKGILIKEIVGVLGTEEVYYELAVSDDSNNSYQSCCDTTPSPASIPPLVPQKDSQNKYSKETFKEQQQAPAAAVFSCLKDLEIPHNDKVQITQSYQERVVQHCVAWATHPMTKIKQTLQQAIKWACQQPNLPDIPQSPIDIAEENKKYAVQIEAATPPTAVAKVEALNKHVEVGYFTGLCTCIDYTEKGFKEQLENALRKYGLWKPKT